MMASLDVVVTFETGEPHTGGWCSTCALPSLVEVEISMFFSLPSGTPVSVRTIHAAYCTDHDGPPVAGEL